MRIQTLGSILIGAIVLAGCGGSSAAPSSAAPATSAAAKPATSAPASAAASAKPAASAAASAAAKPAASGAAAGSAAAKPAASGAAAAAPSVPASVTLAVGTSATLGKILTDDKNRTLYQRVNDTPTGSGCTAGCLSTWPPLYSSSMPTAPAGLTGTLTLATRADNGAKQVMLNDKPLYFFTPDQPGDTKGEGVGDPQTWHVVKIG